MHSSCRIPDVPRIFTGTYTKNRQLCQGLGELTSRDPTWKTRRKNQVCGRRLVQHLASLSQQCEDSKSRINHDIRATRSLLLSSSSPIFCRPLSPRTLSKQPDPFLCSIKSETNQQKAADNQKNVSVSPAQSRESRYILDDNITMDFNGSGGSGCASNSYNKNNLSTSELNKVNKTAFETQNLLLPTVFASKDLSSFVHDSKQDVGKTITSADPRDVKKRQRWKFSARLCGYGESDIPRNCYHFPCKRPTTYSHIGFRAQHPQLKTLQWMRNSVSPKTTRSESENIGNSASVTKQIIPCRNKTESLKHRLPSAVKLRPVDTAFREQLLREEADRRRRVHQMSRPTDWEINYGQPTPFKRLWYPVRLKANELTSW
ncbi:hypothetical protein RRG08_022237 [Elysia crispata]|uniref:Uncharacterized protein n=1 Tax=Elysia crispata TaxID=231223 RepID=A0AAE0ZQ82_9GAST|nr:hypothetical protein RRG08_022237 [Elysia crispata]